MKCARSCTIWPSTTPKAWTRSSPGALSAVSPVRPPLPPLMGTHRAVPPLGGRRRPPLWRGLVSWLVPPLGSRLSPVGMPAVRTPLGSAGPCVPGPSAVVPPIGRPPTGVYVMGSFTSCEKGPHAWRG